MSGSPYDTSDVREVLSRLSELTTGPLPKPPTDTQPGSIILPLRLADKLSGFLDRLLEDHFAGRGAFLGTRTKDPSGSTFNVPTTEHTLTWGALGDLSFDTSNPAEVSFPIVSQQLVKVHRTRPTTMTLMAVFNLVAGWTGENGINLTASWQVGVGQSQATILRKFAIAAASVANNTQVVFDVITVPAQAVQGAVSLSMSPANNAPHSANAIMLAAPVVQ